MSKLFAAFLLCALPGVCQQSANEPDTLRALLSEVHQLRQDIEAITVASQRVQIALYSLQVQDAAVARATQRADDARTKCAALTENRDRTAAQIRRIETMPIAAAGTPEAEEARAYKLHVADMKPEMETQAAAVQSCQSAEAGAQNQLQVEQAKLADLRDRIEHLDKTLEKLGVAEK